ncbi:MAG: mannose-1-phosphate guanylyltransferase [Prolixibacteraceae bacterium]
MKNNYCVIMAGGIGSRFWPLSKSSMPKQFLDITGTGRTLIQMTFDRFRKVCPVENFLVVTNVSYKELVLSQLPELGEEQVLLEPLRRNTAPCIAYACNRINLVNPGAHIIVAPSDHLILQEKEFLIQVEAGLEFITENDALVTLGITPHRPETAYGYIQIDGRVPFRQMNNLFKVKTFTEKPGLEMANVFIESGEFFWNAGIFIWQLKGILQAFDTWLPDMASLFKRGEKLYGTDDEVYFINKTYSECQNISIDYGIMEKAENVYVLCSDFGWSDLETWGALYESLGKDEHANYVKGESVLLYNSQNCLVNVPDDKIVVLQGLDGYIVVESENTLLVCRKEDEQQIRQFVNDVRQLKGTQYA